MAAKNDSPAAQADPSKDQLARPGRDGREAAHNDSTDESTNNPPNHGIPTHGVGRFLWECDPATPVDQLGDLYARWRDDSSQTDLGAWSK